MRGSWRRSVAGLSLDYGSLCALPLGSEATMWDDAQDAIRVLDRVQEKQRSKKTT